MSLVHMALINWLLKLKMHANTFFFWILFCMKIWYETFYIFERLGPMHENKTFFFHILFSNISEKIEYLILDLYFYWFVFLQYKNTNQY
jgi:hypothetical protein